MALVLIALVTALCCYVVLAGMERASPVSLLNHLGLASKRRAQIRAVVAGEHNKVEGAIVTDQELLTSLSGERCIWWRLHVFHWEGRRHKRLVTDFVREVAVTFQLDDGSGRIVVETVNATLICAPLHVGRWVDARELHAPSLAPAALNCNPELTYEELVVYPDDRLIVYGPVVAGSPMTIGGFDTVVDKPARSLKARFDDFVAHR